MRPPRRIARAVIWYAPGDAHGQRGEVPDDLPSCHSSRAHGVDPRTLVDGLFYMPPQPRGRARPIPPTDELPDDMRDLPHVPELAVHEAHVHRYQLLQLSSECAPGNAYSQSGRVPDDLRELPYVYEHMVGARAFLFKRMLELPSWHEAGHAHGQHGEVPDDLRDMPLVPELELHASDRLVYELQQLPFGSDADAAHAVHQPLRHALPELPYLPGLAAGQLQPFVLAVPHEPQGLLALLRLPPCL